jgi:hypothetical protein
MNTIPSEVVAYIDRSFPNVQLENRHLGYKDAGFLRGLEALLSQIDPILLPTGKDGADLTACRATIMSHVRMWETQGNTSALEHLKGRKESILATVRGILQKCPDEPLATDINEFDFIVDESLRNELLKDLGSVSFLMRQKQWKAAMVLAGALIEAVLLEQLGAFDPKTIDVSRKKIGEGQADSLRWHLPSYVKVAADLQIIGEITRKQCDISGDLRNLIHPGKAIRKSQECDIAAAFSVIAGLEHVIRDVRKWCGTKGLKTPRHQLGLSGAGLRSA